MSRREETEMIWQFLRQFFYDDFYEEAIENVKKANAEDPRYLERWERIVKVIREQKLLPGEALSLVYDGANQPLDADSDEEAYSWLNKMIRNVEREDGIIEEY